MKEFKKSMMHIRYHALVLLKGLLVMLVGTLIATLIAVSVCSFCVVPSVDGYAAVLDFLIGIGTLACAVYCLYNIGGGTRATKK